MKSTLVLLLSVLSISSIANAGFKFGGLTVNQVNTQLESLLLPQINQLRSSAHPAPDTPLESLTWDANLAKSAGQWASKCIVDDNSDDYYAGKVGESITTLTIRDLVKNLIRAGDGVSIWAAQNATYDYTSDNCFHGDKAYSCSDYRQLLWDNTKKIGCATNICKKQASLVCQYYPPGDAPGVRPFSSSAQDLTALAIDLTTGNLTRIDVEESNAAAPSSKRAVVRGTNNYGDSCKPDPNSPTGECTIYNTCASTGGRLVIWGSAICGGGDNVLCCIRDNDYVPIGSPTSSPTPSPSPTDAPTPSPTPVPPSPTSAPPSPTSAPPSPTSAPATKAPTPTPTKASTPTPTKAPTPVPSSPTSAPSSGRLTLPAGSYNWRGTQAVTPIKNQQQCGSCWSFSSSAAAESAWAIKTGGSQLDLAEQRLVDCVTASKGCNGGTAPSAFSYLIANGGISEKNDPYEQKQGTCDAPPASIGATWSKYVRMSDKSDEAIKAALVQYGPMVVYVNADNVWQSYRSGIISGQSTSINHAVLLVGYDANENAWIIKNSWGTGWGDAGYVHVDVNGNFGMKVEGPYYIIA